MATIKSLLSTTLESFLTSKKEWSTNQVMPASSYITINPTKQSDLSETSWSFTASCDGYVKAGAYGMGGTYQSTFYFADRSGIQGVTFNYATLFFPVKKGQNLVFNVNNVSSMEIRLYKALSGT